MATCNASGYISHEKRTDTTYSNNVKDEFFALKFMLNVLNLDKIDEKLTRQKTLKAPYSTESSRMPGTGLARLGSDANTVFVISSGGEIG